MRWFADTSFRTKVTVPVVILALLMLAVALFSHYSIARLNEGTEQIARNNLPAIDRVLQADRDMYQALVAERSFIFLDVGDAAYHKMVAMHQENIAQAEERVAQLAAMKLPAGAAERLSQFQTAYGQWKTITAKVVKERTEGGRLGRRTAIDLTFGEGDNRFNEAREQLNQLTDLIEQHAEQQQQALETLATQSSRIQNGALIVGLVVILVLIGVLPGLIVKPLRQLLDRIEAIAHGDGDLTARVEVYGSDELGQLARSFNSFIGQLHDIIAKVVESTHSVLVASQQLAVQTANANHALTQQYGSTDQVATAINQMAVTLQAVAHDAGEAATSAQYADSNARQGRTIVLETIKVIEELASDVNRATGVIRSLSEDSHTIGGVLDVIRGIAEQTNLLALNAAIEAARAGESGRGFAVVADEVRTLASRTQQSTLEIQAIIAKLQQGAEDAVNVMAVGQNKVRASVDQATRAGQALEAITDSVAAISQMNSRIAQAADEQNSVADSINQSVSAIRHAADESAASSQQMSQFSSSLAVLAAGLKQQVGQFRV